MIHWYYSERHTLQMHWDTSSVMFQGPSRVLSLSKSGPFVQITQLGLISSQLATQQLLFVGKPSLSKTTSCWFNSNPLRIIIEEKNFSRSVCLKLFHFYLLICFYFVLILTAFFYVWDVIIGLISAILFFVRVNDEICTPINIEYFGPFLRIQYSMPDISYVIKYKKGI